MFIVVFLFFFRIFVLKLLGLTGYLFWCFSFRFGSIDGSNVGIDGLLVFLGGAIADLLFFIFESGASILVHSTLIF